MQTSVMKLLAVGGLALGAPAVLANVEGSRVFFQATCTCKSSADCTCPKGQCKCKRCGNATFQRIFDSLREVNETTRLPDTARNDARGGVFI
jgi:uncharacterized Zn finger protein